MMKIRLSALAGLCLLATSVCAQKEIPPVFSKQDASLMRYDEMSQYYITPSRLVWASSKTAVQDAEKLLIPNTGQTELGSKDMCHLLTHGTDTASIILDYGRELHGGIRLVFGDAGMEDPSLIRIRFGESVEETCSTENSLHPQVGYSTNHHAMRDLQVKVPQWGQIEIGNTGFRFVRIDLLRSDVQLNLKEATAILRYRAIPYIGSFECDDELLNSIWLTGAYTVHLNMQEYLWDGIKRDRLIWLGDMHPETSTIATVFGYNDVVDKSIDLACERWPLPNWHNNMSAYSMWYLIILYEWYMHNGDMDYLKKHQAYVTGLIDLIDGLVDANGDEHLSRSRFLDWPSSPNPKGVEAGYRGLLVWAMNDAEKLCRVYGNEAEAAKCRDIAGRIKKQLKDANGLKQAAALMAIGGLITPRQACEEVVSVGGAKGFSTFYGYYMLQALAMDGRYEEAMGIIKDFWGGMLKLGATTFWEDFNLDWAKNASRLDEFSPADKDDIHGDFGDYCYKGFRHSLCHGWASGPTPWLTQHVLGIEVVEPGCKVIKVEPHLGALKWAKGTFPTPYGAVSVEHRKDATGKVLTKIKAPKGVKVIRK